MKHGRLEFWANCDLTTYNAQGQSSGFKGHGGDVGGGAKWQMHCKASYPPFPCLV